MLLTLTFPGFWFHKLSFKIIMAAVAEKVADGNILRLIERFQPTTEGTPQGGVLSPLLANIVLNQMDWQLEKLGWHFVPYADDFVVVCQTPAKAEEALANVQQILQGLGVKLSAEKTRITTYGKGYSFLGFWLSKPSRR